MRESGIGRVLVASLHQAISDLLPMRLIFYENFLAVEALRDGTIGLAPLSAVLSFLRQEGAAYEQIMTRAGELAAEWAVQSMTRFERSTISSAPKWLRVHLVFRVARQLVRRSCERSRASIRVRRGTARIELHDSVFCSVREPSPRALCGFYAAAGARLLGLFDIPAIVTGVECRGRADRHNCCVLKFSFTGASAASRREETAA